MPDQLVLDAERLPAYLEGVGLATRSDVVGVEAVGDGNINWVRRVRLRDGSLVVKQARPALERFPEYRVSTERIVFEARFYEAAAGVDTDAVCPRVLAFDPEQRVLVLEDLGDAERMDAALARGADLRATAARLAGFLARLHAATADGALAPRFCNDEMRRLHGDHIYRLPYRENDFPLSPEVAKRARALREDRALIERIDAAYARYLEPRGALLHGDVQPTNVLLADGGPRLLDAEIAHVGDPAFDVGQLVGHLLLPAAARGDARAALPAVRAAWRAYRAERGPAAPRLEEAAHHAGVELLRRTLGAARVPAVASDRASLAVVDTGVALLRDDLDLGER